MADEPPRVPLEGGTRSAPLHDRFGVPDTWSTAMVTVYLRGGAERAAPGRLTREEYTATYGATAADIEAVGNFARAQGLTVGPVSTGRRSVEVTVTLSALAEAFGVTLPLCRDPEDDENRARVGAVQLPAGRG